MIYRSMTPGDRRFVVPTWAKSSRYDGLYLRERFELIDRILDTGARVSVLSTDGRSVHAWACGSDDTLHYVYVPPELRGHGIGRRAIAHVLDDYDCHINVTHQWPRSSSRFRYTPHLLQRDAA